MINVMLNNIILKTEWRKRKRLVLQPGRKIYLCILRSVRSLNHDDNYCFLFLVENLSVPEREIWAGAQFLIVLLQPYKNFELRRNYLKHEHIINFENILELLLPAHSWNFLPSFCFGYIFLAGCTFWKIIIMEYHGTAWQITLHNRPFESYVSDLS